MPNFHHFYVGTSGFSYPEWKGSFYPSNIKNTQLLNHYASSLPSVEINYTFRRFPSEKLLTNWRAQVPPGFLFTLKAHQSITHRLRLANAEQIVADFVQRAEILGDLLGVVFFQCPPNLRYDPKVLADFLQGLPPGHRYAMEFRHPSFDQDSVRQQLSEAGVTGCVSDTGQGPALQLTPSFQYVRMRDEEIGEAGLLEWVPAICASLEQTDVFVYFKHEGLGGVEALRFKHMVERARREVGRM